MYSFICYAYILIWCIFSTCKQTLPRTRTLQVWCVSCFSSWKMRSGNMSATQRSQSSLYVIDIYIEMDIPLELELHLNVKIIKNFEKKKKLNSLFHKILSASVLKGNLNIFNWKIRYMNLILWWNLCCLFQIRCFLDFKPGGALCHILAAVYKFKSDQGW